MPIQKSKNTRSKTPAQNPDPELALSELKFTPSRQLLEAALSQLALGEPNVTTLCSSLTDSQSYGALLRWGYRLSSQTVSPGQMSDALNRIAFEALSAGWIAHEAAVESRLLEKLVLRPSIAGAQRSTSRRASKRKAAEQ
jgi:hypothetical protein